ncbi:MAG: VWA domain-containing protein, partial [Pyrinomonadaceae bacterium]
MNRFIRFSLAWMLLIVASVFAQAQHGPPTPTPTPPANQDQDPIKVFTEEVRLPVVAVDQYGRFDPTLVADDILVQEDGVPQNIASVRRIPASVLMLLGTGGGPNPAVKTSTTRDVALRLLGRLRISDRVAVMQFSNKVEELQAWTADQKAAEHVLRNQLHTGNGTLLVPALRAAAAMLQFEPVGNRHLVLITDGVDVPDGRAKFADLMDTLKPSAA